MKDVYFIIHTWIEDYKKFKELYNGLIYTDYKRIMELCAKLNATADHWELYEVEKGRLIE